MSSLPSITRIVTANFYLETNTQSFESPLNRAGQYLALPGARWRMSVSLPKMTREQAAPWIAFFMKLRGRANTFTASDPDWQVNRGSWAGSPLVAGAGQTGNTLYLDGAAASVAGWGRKGDYFTVASKLYRLTEDSSTDGSGNVSVTFEPPILVAPADNAPLTFNPGTVSMRVTDDRINDWPVDRNGIYAEKSFEAMEDL